MMEVREGDVLTIHRPNYRRGQSADVSKHKVCKVARKYFYVQDRAYGDPSKFSLENGREWTGPNGNGTYAATAYTHESWADHERRRIAMEPIAEFRRGYSLHEYTTEQLERIAAILNERVPSAGVGEPE